MKVYFNVEAETAEEITRLATAMAVLGGGASAAQWVTTAQGETEVVVTSEGDLPPAGPNEAPGETGPKLSPAAQRLVNDLITRQKAVSVKGGMSKSGVRLVPDDTVVNADGELCVVEWMYRGHAVVVYEDGKAEDLPTNTLDPYIKGENGPDAPKPAEEQPVEPAGEEAQPAEEQQAEPAVADAEVVEDAGGLDLSAPEEEQPAEDFADIDFNGLAALGGEHAKMLGSPATQKLFVRLAGTAMLKTVPKGQFPVLARALKAEIDAEMKAAAEAVSK